MMKSSLLLLLAMTLPLLINTEDLKCSEEQHVETSSSGQQFCATNTKGCTKFNSADGSCAQCGSLYSEVSGEKNGQTVLRCDEILYIWIPVLIIISGIAVVLVW